MNKLIVKFILNTVNHTYEESERIYNEYNRISIKINYNKKEIEGVLNCIMTCFTETGIINIDNIYINKDNIQQIVFVDEKGNNVLLSQLCKFIKQS